MMRGYCLALGCLLTWASVTARADGGVATCGAVTIKGCCQGTLLYFCAAGELKQQDCAAAPSCGWDPALSYYACGTAGGDDPSGKHSRSCPGLADAGARDIPSIVLDLPVLPVGDIPPPDSVPPDSRPTGDGAGADAGGEHGGETGACGCHVGRPPRPAPWWLFLVLLAWKGRTRHP
jgi:MYXO-CTERM domain-containing protein